MKTLQQQFEKCCRKEDIEIKSDYSHIRDCYSDISEQSMYEDFVDHKITEAINTVNQDYIHPHTLQHSTEEYVHNAIEQLIRAGYRK